MRIRIWNKSKSKSTRDPARAHNPFPNRNPPLHLALRCQIDSVIAVRLQLLLLYFVVSISQSATAQCNPHWVQGVGDPGINGDVFALASFNDGSGPALYVGGFFSMAGGVATNGVARWNGTAWSGVGGSGLDFSGLSSMTVFDDGTGPALYVGGYFNHISGVTATCIAKWTGTTWSALGLGINGTVYTLHAFNDGSGPALFAGGNFSIAGGVPAAHVAKWNGSSWSALSTGTDNEIFCSASYDDGSGPAIYFGGRVESAGGVPVMHVARWNGSKWSAVGAVGVPGGAGEGDHPHTLYAFPDGGPQRLFVGGFFATADGNTVRNAARWNGSTWQPMNVGFNSQPKAAAVFDDRTGAGPQLTIGGEFNASGLVSMNYAAKWNGTAWAPLGPGTNDAIQAVVVHDFGLGEGPAFFVGGYFSMSAGLAAHHVAQWNGAGQPTLTQNPANASVTAGQQVAFSAAAIGNPTLSYQWRRSGVSLSDGGAISGATTPTLTINPATAAYAGLINVVVTNGCGSTPSASALLTVNPACAGDTYADAYVDGLDISGFVTCVLTGQNCSATDLDGDGQTADVDADDDLAAFVTKLLRQETACP